MYFKYPRLCKIYGVSVLDLHSEEGFHSVIETALLRVFQNGLISSTVPLLHYSALGVASKSMQSAWLAVISVVLMEGRSTCTRIIALPDEQCYLKHIVRIQLVQDLYIFYSVLRRNTVLLIWLKENYCSPVKIRVFNHRIKYWQPWKATL